MARDITVKATLEGGQVKAKASLSSGIVRASADIKDVIRESVPGDYVGPDVARRGPGDMYSAGAFVYAPAGYYPNLAAQSVDISTSLPKPSISVSETGMITATEEITDSAFFQRGLTAEKTRQLTQQRGKTVTPSDVEQTAVTAGKYTIGDVKVGPIPYTKHQIYFGFADETNVTIPLYCSDAVIAEIITGYTPTTYVGKEVIMAQLDGVTWYEKPVEPEPSGTWETLYPTTSTQFIPNGEGEPGSYCWISQMGDTPFVVGDQYRITYDGTSYEVTAHANAQYGAVIGDESWVGTPIWIMCMYGAWIGSIETKAEAVHLLQVEHFVSD